MSPELHMMSVHLLNAQMILNHVRFNNMQSNGNKVGGYDTFRLREEIQKALDELTKFEKGVSHG